MKYLFIIPSLSKGGAEKVVSILSNELIRRNKKVTIIVHYNVKKDFEYKVSKKVKVICLSDLYENDYRRKINLFYLIKLILKLRKKIRTEEPDYILPFLFTTCIRTELALFGTKYKRKIIHTVRNNPASFPKNKLIRKYRDMLIYKSNKTIVQNSEQKEYFAKRISNKIYILNNPVDEEIFKIKNNNKKEIINIIGVGRLEKQKNFSLLIKAFSEINSKYKNTYLYIYGEGSLRDELNNQIESLNLKNKAFLKGRKNNYKEIYGNADIFVLSSNDEGMPNALLEAMGSKIACITTNCPTGPSDIVTNEYDGLIIPVNDKNNMIKALELLITKRDYRIKLSKNARKTIKNKYTKEYICDELIKICEQSVV